MPKDFRMERVADLIRTTLTTILLHQSEDDRFAETTITQVSVSRDLRHARIYISVLKEETSAEIVDALNKAAKFLRFQLANSINLRVTPQLRFYYDDSHVKGDRIMSLLSKALKDKN